jgi:hypothetical protein
MNGQAGFIDKSGNIVIEPYFDKAFYFSEGLAAVELSGQWGFIDKKGRFVINPQFGHVSTFQGGVARVRPKNVTRSRSGIIDREGRYILEPGQYETHDSFYGTESGFSEGMCGVKFIDAEWDDSKLCYAGEKWGFINMNSERVIHPLFDNCSPFHEGLASVMINEQWGFIDKSGKIVIPPQFFKYVTDEEFIIDGEDTMDFFINPGFKNGLAEVWLGRRMGYIDKTGQYVWKPRM